MGSVTFSGSVSVQTGPGEIVTITVTKPDNTTESVTAPTQADGSYSFVYTNVGGSYSVQAHIDEDADNEAADSPVVLFNILKNPRTITLNVS